MRLLAMIGIFFAAIMGGVLVSAAIPQPKPCTWQVQYHSFGHYEEVTTLLNSLTPAQARNAKVVSYHGYGSEGTPATDVAVWVCVP